MTGPDRALRRALDLARDQADVISRRQALGAGMTPAAVDWLLRQGTWAALLAGVYSVHAALYGRVWTEQSFVTRLQASLLAHGPDCVAVMETAARIHRMPGLPPDDGTIHLVRVPGGERHQQPGVRLHTRRLPASQIEVRSYETVRAAGVTSVLFTTADLARSMSRWDAVGMLDALLHEGRVCRSDLGGLDALVRGLRGARGARERVLLADGRAASPLETRVRLIATDAGMPPDRLQLPVLDRAGRLLGYGDMAWHRPGRRTLIAEADGKLWHDAPSALYRDRARANDFSATDEVDVVRFTWEDTLRRSYIVSVLRTHLAPRS
ncbi:MAG: type IV toxin-antitoxin system AbiEi family antitoxin domain-containing protein [Actinomycetes bacterium]